MMILFIVTIDMRGKRDPWILKMFLKVIWNILLLSSVFRPLYMPFSIKKYLASLFILTEWFVGG